MFILYFYAGVAKINPDWLAGEPLRMWFRRPEAVQYLEPWVPSSVMQSIRTFLAQEYAIWGFAYGGLIFDLAIGFLLVFRRTRLLGFFLMLGFHTFNYFSWKIVVFPVMAVCLTMIFFEPDGPDRVWRWVRHPKFVKPDWRWLIGGAILLPLVGAALGWKFSPTPLAKNRRTRLAPWTTILVLGWLLFQAVVPLRHFLIEGPSNWTEEGTMFSWHTMLRTKVLGNCRIEIVDPDLPMIDSDVGRFVDWRLPGNRELLTPFHQVTSCEVPWEELPEFVIVSEPIVGEQIVYNPLAKGAHGGDSVDYVRRYWLRVYGHEPKYTYETHSLGKLLDDHEAYIMHKMGRVDPAHVPHSGDVSRSLASLISTDATRSTQICNAWSSAAGFTRCLIRWPRTHRLAAISCNACFSNVRP